MEAVAFLGLLGAGYFMSRQSAKNEGFVNVTPSTFVPDDGSDKSRRGQPTIPGKPRIPTYASAGGYDIQFQLPQNGSLPSEPNTDGIHGGPLHFPVSPITLPSQNEATVAQALQTRPDRWEDAPRAGGFVSALSGVQFKPGEFKHANMVPFAKKFTQSTVDNANGQRLDAFTGSGKTLYAKKEQAPFFEPTKEPIGNPYGFESTTDFMGSRVVESRNRAGERPMEPVHVGPGLNAGYTSLPSGGYQQQDGRDYVQDRLPRVNDLRVATNPKVSYDVPIVPGSHFITTSGTAETIGEVRKYNPDRFYINEKGERNFVTVGADTKPVSRATTVLRDVTRPSTSKAYKGTAGQAEGKATYTVGSTRTPLVKQLGDWGIRNADLTANFNKDTDASQNDYGKSGVEILPNERYYTGERVHATNVKPDQREVELPLQDGPRDTRHGEILDAPRPAGNFGALGNGLAEKATLYDPNDPLRTTIKETTIDNDWIGMVAPVGALEKPTLYDPSDPMRTTTKETTIDNDWIGMAAPVEAQPKLTVYDPNDTARTTIRETTEDGDYIGISGPADCAQKLTVYDPDDIARVTGRNTLDDWDRYRNFGRQDGPEKAESRIQDGVRQTQKAAISAKSSWSGPAEAAVAKAETNRTAARAMRTYAQRENVSRGRNPMGSSVKLYNGEDNVNLQYRRIVADSVNDREPGMDRVNSEPTSAATIGVQRPRSVLKLDIASERNHPVFVEALESNPYVLPLHVTARVGGKYAI